MPTIRPPNRVSRNGPMSAPARPPGRALSAPSGGQRTKRAWGQTSMHRAQVGADDFRVVAHLIRQPIADLLAIVEDDDPVADVHDDAHVVLDQHDGSAELVVDVEDEAAHVL